MTQAATQTQIIITEEYAVEVIKTGRGIMAEVKDVGSTYNGTYALSSIAAHALAALKAKIREKQGR